MDLIAIHQIQRVVKSGEQNPDGTTKKSAVMETIQPGASFSTDADTGNALIAQRAARKPGKDDPKPATNTAQTESEAAAQQAQKTGTSADEEADFEAAKAEYVEVFGEEPSGRITKAETLREKIAEKRAADETAGMV